MIGCSYGLRKFGESKVSQYQSDASLLCTLVKFQEEQGGKPAWNDKLNQYFQVLGDVR